MLMLLLHLQVMGRKVCYTAVGLLQVLRHHEVLSKANSSQLNGKIKTMKKTTRFKFAFALIFLTCEISCHQESVHDKILQWWQKVSEQKPLKCQVQSSYLQPFHPMAQKLIQETKILPYIIQRNCTTNDTLQYQFTFKGQYVNGLFDGPGKLQIDLKRTKRRTPGELFALKEKCFTINGFNPYQLKEVGE